MVMVVAREDAAKLVSVLNESGETAAQIGEIVPHEVDAGQKGSSTDAGRVQLKNLDAF